MKIYIKLSVLFNFLLTITATAQYKQPSQYRDYEAVDNLDSLKSAVYALKGKPNQYLTGLISLEKSRYIFSDDFGVKEFGQDLPTIENLAKQQNSPLAMAAYNFMRGQKETNLEESTKYIIKAIQYFESHKDTTGMITCYNNMIGLHINLLSQVNGNIKNAKYYYDKIMDLGQKSNFVGDKLTRLKVILVFSRIINSDKNTENGVAAFNEAIRLINLNPKFKDRLFVFYANIGNLYGEFGQLQKAFAYHLKLYETDSKNRIGQNSFNLAFSYYSLGDYKNAELYIKKTLAIFLASKTQNTENLLGIYDVLADVQFKNKQYNEAWNSRNAKDSLSQLNEEKLHKKAFLDLQTKYQTEQKEQANIQLQKEKNQLYVYLVIGGLLILSILYFLYRLRKANARIKEFMKQRDDFYTMMIHDIRGPISTLSIIGKVVGFLLKQNRISELFEVTNRINIISSQTDLMLNNMLEWGKENKFGLIIKPQTLDVSKIIDDLYQSYKSLAEAKGISMSVEMPTGLEIFADPKSIIIIIRNMIDNAQKFTQEGGLIKIIVQQMKESQQIAIQVKNSGVGIASEQLKQLQQIFADKIRPSVGEMGIGLGTILMNDFAKKNKATIEVNNESGFGTCFSLILPN